MTHAFFNTKNWFIFIAGGFVIAASCLFLAYGDYSVPGATELTKSEFLGPIPVQEENIEVKGAHVRTLKFSLPDGTKVNYAHGMPQYDELPAYLGSNGPITVLTGKMIDVYLFALALGPSDRLDIKIRYDDVVAVQRSRLPFELGLGLTGTGLLVLMLFTRKRFMNLLPNA